MLTKDQIKSLEPGTYTNQQLREKFPNDQGPGKSSYFRNFNKLAEEGKEQEKDPRTGWYVKGRQI